MKKGFVLIYLLLSIFSTSIAAYGTTIKVLPLKALDYKTVNLFCRPMLSKGGAMAYLKSQRAVVVNDKKEVIAKIADFIKQAGGELKNIRITIDYAGSGHSQQQEFGLNSQFLGGINNRKRLGSARVHGVVAVNKSFSSARNTQMQLVTISGYAASLWVGKEVPEIKSIRNYILDPRANLYRLGNRVILNSVDFEMRQVGVKLLIRPVLQGDGLIRVELFPEVSYYNKKKRRDSLQVQSLKTAVVVSPGQRVSIGGLVSSKKNGYINLFGPDFFKNGEGQKILKMFVTAKVL